MHKALNIIYYPVKSIQLGIKKLPKLLIQMHLSTVNLSTLDCNGFLVEKHYKKAEKK